MKIRAFLLCILALLLLSGLQNNLVSAHSMPVATEASWVVASTEGTLQKTLNTYILDVYKTQGDKILQDLDANLEKIAPAKHTRIEAYSSIQKSLSARLNTITEDESISANARTILIKYLDHMIRSIEAKKKTLE